MDQIYLDPPFNSNANYAAPIGSAAFKDTWMADDAWHGELAEERLALYHYLESGDPREVNVLSYLIYMAVRLRRCDAY